MVHLMTGLQVSLVGITVVFGALLLIAGVLGLLNRLTQLPQPKPNLTPDPMTEEVIVVLAAAAEAVLGEPVVVHRVRYGNPQTDHAWSEQGRFTIMASHITRS